MFLGVKINRYHKNYIFISTTSPTILHFWKIILKILGIDPGSNKTGLGIIDAKKQILSYQFSGCIKTTGTVNEKLKIIFQSLLSVAKQHQPDVVVIERIFMRPDRPNPEATIKLAQARGTIISAITHLDIPIVEYTPNQIKKTVVGKGHANKKQVSFMIKHLLKLEKEPQSDAADALAGAVCHAYHLL